MTQPIKSIERIIDLNLNRLREGLKISEDILRFHYQDKKLLLDLRKIRQKLLPIMREIEVKVIPFRASEKDLGRRKEFDKIKRRDIFDLFSANIKRAEAAARILEEFFKIKEPRHSSLFKEARFALYDLEKEFHQKYSKPLTLTIYTILDIESLSAFFPKVPPLSSLGYILATASDAIQLRGKKDSSSRELLKQASAVKRGIKQTKRDVKFIINDRVDICLAVGADGVHLGKEDMPLKKARELLPEKVIGFTVRNLTDLKMAEMSGCDYVGCGSVFPSPTKPRAPVIGLKRLKSIVEKSSIPVVAIGGINRKNLPQVLKTGVAGIACVSAIFGDGQIEKNLLALRQAINRSPSKRK